MKISSLLGVIILAGATLFSGRTIGAGTPASFASEPADVIIYNAKVLTVNSNFTIAQAVAIRDGKIVAVGKDKLLETYRGPETRLIDAQGKTVMPGLFDANVYSFQAAVSELNGALPVIDSIAAAQEYIRSVASNKPASGWIIVDDVYPTRLKDGRMPVKADLDAATTNYAVMWNLGVVTVVNSKALALSKITKGTQNPRGGIIEKDPKHFNPTGVLRNAQSVLKLPKDLMPATRQQERDALRRLYALYNAQGITSISEIAEPKAIDLFRDLSRSNELSVRITARRLVPLIEDLDASIDQLNMMTNGPSSNEPYGPTGAGDDWVRIGPLETVIDGQIQFGTAYLRTPYGIGPLFDIEELAYRGFEIQDSYLLGQYFAEAAQRGWQLAGHASGDAALDFLLNGYEKVQFKQDIRDRRFLVLDSSFQAAQDWRRCEALGVGVVTEPVSVYEDGSNLLKTLGAQRMDEFMAFKGWFDRGITAGGASGHVAGTNSLAAATPWNPWLGMWTTLTRETKQGSPINPQERLSREQAIRFYTINNAWLNFQEKQKGSIEPGKLADLIVVDNDLLKCPVDQVRNTHVLMTMVNGKVVWEANVPVLPGPELVTPSAFTDNVTSPARPAVAPATNASPVYPEVELTAKPSPAPTTGTATNTRSAATNAVAVSAPATTPAPAAHVSAADDQPNPLAALDGAEEATNAVAEAKSPATPAPAAGNAVTNSAIATNAATVITVSNQSASVTVTIQPNVATTNVSSSITVTNETAATPPAPALAPASDTKTDSSKLNPVEPAAPAPAPTAAAAPASETTTPATVATPVAPVAPTAAPAASTASTSQTSTNAPSAAQTTPDVASTPAPAASAPAAATETPAVAQAPRTDAPATNQVTDPLDWSHLVSQEAK